MFKKLNYGFTMVELMIVIAIIGIIAVAVLSAINPVEQINKGKDTRTRSDSGEMLNALERYYATDERYPWVSVGSTASSDASIPWTAQQVASALVAQSELKDSFVNRVGNLTGQSDLQLYVGGTETDLFVCFNPASAQFKREALAKSTNWVGSAPAWLLTQYCMP